MSDRPLVSPAGSISAVLGRLSSRSPTCLRFCGVLVGDNLARRLCGAAAGLDNIAATAAVSGKTAVHLVRGFGCAVCIPHSRRVRGQCSRNLLPR